MHCMLQWAVYSGSILLLPVDHGAVLICYVHMHCDNTWNLGAVFNHGENYQLEEQTSLLQCAMCWGTEV